VTVTFHALWMLCALGATTFAAAAAPRRGWLAAFALGFLAVLMRPGGQPDPEIAGLFAASGAFVYLFRPRYAWLGFALGGALAGMLVQVVGLVGGPAVVTAPLVALGAGATVWLTRTRAGFAPEALREEALLIVCTLGLAVAVLPSVLDGWQAAANLNTRMENVAQQAFPAWVLSIVATSSLLGAAYALWSRR
jgi:hypothetical protein